MTEIYVPSTWRRFLAVSIDQILMLVGYLPFSTSFYRAFTSDEDVFISIYTLLALFLIPAVYEAVSLALLQATPGKWLLGLKVVPAADPFKELHWSQCLLRPLTSRLTFFFSWAIYALAFFRYDRTHLSDWVAETRVIQFTPRSGRAGVRWIVGSFLILSYTFEGLTYAAAVLNEIDWKKGQIELHNLVAINGMDEMPIDVNLNDEDDGE